MSKPREPPNKSKYFCCMLYPDSTTYDVNNLIKSLAEEHLTFALSPIHDRDIENEKLKALKDKAGNAVAFKVSDNYKKKCASCHGAGGEGIVGLPLYGQSAESIYTKLVEFKSGRRENAIMKGAIMNVTEAEFKELSQEISEFKARFEALSK